MLSHCDSTLLLSLRCASRAPPRSAAKAEAMPKARTSTAEAARMVLRMDVSLIAGYCGSDKLRQKFPPDLIAGYRHSRQPAMQGDPRRTVEIPSSRRCETGR